MTLTFGDVVQSGFGYSSILRAIERLLIMRSATLPRQYDASFEGITRALWDLGMALEGAIPPPAISTAGPLPPFWDTETNDYVPGGLPADGSFWFDTRQGRLFVAMNGEWHQTNGAESLVHAGPAPPPRDAPGVLWFDTRQGACFIYLDEITASGEAGWYQLNGALDATDEMNAIAAFASEKADEAAASAAEATAAAAALNNVASIGLAAGLSLALG